MVSKYPIVWSEEAVRNLESILEYLYARWTQREVDNFKRLLAKQLILIKIKKPIWFICFKALKTRSGYYNF
jgi:hypothetical protein